MKKTLIRLLSLLVCLTVAAGCSAQTAPSGAPPVLSSSEAASVAAPAPEEVEVRVAALKGPTAMGLVKLMSDSEAGDAKGNYAFTIAASADEITPKLIQGQLDIAAVPANLSSVLYNNTKGQVKVLAVHTLGILYIVEKGDTIHSIEDLRGKTIYSSGKGATPEYALNYLLSANGIDPVKDVTVEYKSEHAEVVAALALQDNGIAMLPQPFVTTAQMKEKSLRIALDLNEEWDKLQTNEANPSGLITGVMAARSQFIDERPQAVAAFLAEYAESVAYANQNVNETAALIGKYDIVPEAVAKIALPYCNIVFIDGDEMKAKLSGYLKVLLDQNPKSVGGALPNEDFYYGGK